MPVGKIWNGSAWVDVGTGATVVQNAGRLGDVSWWPFADLPDDAVACEGQQITSAWPELRAFLIAKGSPFGTAGGNPLMLDMKGLMPVGQDATQIEFDTLLETGGTKAHGHTVRSPLAQRISDGITGLLMPDGNDEAVADGTAVRSFLALGFPAAGQGVYLRRYNTTGASNLPPYRVGRFIMRARTVFTGLGSQFATEQYVAQQAASMRAGDTLGYALLVPNTSAGAGDKLAITVTDPPGDVEIYGGGMVHTTGGGGAQISLSVWDGAGATGNPWTGQFAHVVGASYQMPMILPPRHVPKWSGSKTFRLHLNNSAGTPVLYGSGSGAPATLIARLANVH